MILHASRSQWKMEILEGIRCLEVPVGRKTLIKEFLWTFRVQMISSDLSKIAKPPTN